METQPGPGLLVIERILRDRDGIWRQIIEEKGLRQLTVQMLGSSAISLALYGAVLGAVCSPVTLGLHSDWTAPARWIGGAATIALCCIVAYACARITERNSTVELLGTAQAMSDRRIRA